MNILTGKWVHTRKRGQKKVEMSGEGFQQRNVNINKLFAAVVNKDTLRAVLAILAHIDFEINSVDIVLAVLNGELEPDDNIFLYPPEGYQGDSTKVLKLNKSLYGLQQAPRYLNKKIESWLKSVEFVASQADTCLYIRKQGENTIILIINVDDRLIASNNRQHLKEFKSLLNKEFECKDNGPISNFLGMEITRDRLAKRLYMSQEQYLEDVLDRFDMSHCSPVKSTTPADFKPKMATNGEYEAAKHLPYPQIVCSPLYAAVITRTDIAHAASTLSR